MSSSFSFATTCFHQFDPRALAVAGLHVVELAEHVGGRTAGDARHLAEALQRRAVADGAVDGLAVAAGHQCRAFDDAADRNVIDEAGFRIAQVRAHRVHRQNDDAIADRLGAAVRRDEAHAARADEALRHGLGLNHLVEAGGRLQRREIIRGRFHLLIRKQLGIYDHRVGADALALAVLEGLPSAG